MPDTPLMLLPLVSSSSPPDFPQSRVLTRQESQEPCLCLLCLGAPSLPDLSLGRTLACLLPDARPSTFIWGTDSPVSMASSTMQRPRSSSTSHGTRFS